MPPFDTPESERERRVRCAEIGERKSERESRDRNHKTYRARFALPRPSSSSSSERWWFRDARCCCCCCCYSSASRENSSAPAGFRWSSCHEKNKSPRRMFARFWCEKASGKVALLENARRVGSFLRRRVPRGVAFFRLCERWLFSLERDCRDEFYDASLGSHPAGLFFFCRVQLNSIH